VVLLSPGSAWLYAWLPQFRALAKSHTVYVVDIPGQGFTRLHDRDFPFDLTGMTRAVGTFLDAAGFDHRRARRQFLERRLGTAVRPATAPRVSSLMLLAPPASPPPTWTDPVN
jgi:pimeloyl-ACP methyl ester carboxylesterase